MLKSKLSLYAIFSISSLAFMYGCTTTPSATTPTFVASIEKFNAGVASDLQKLQPTLVALTPVAEQAVDVGLALSGNGAIVPVNDAGVAALSALRQSVITGSGIDASTAETITNAAALGLQASGNGKLVPYTAPAAAVISNLINSANTIK
jgi:hypothetical protein